MNVAELLDEQNIKYRESGRDYLVQCLNPEHDDSHPSMRIDKVTGIFNCFSCNFKGDIFNYLGAKPNILDIRVKRLQDKITKMSTNIAVPMPSDAIFWDKKYRNISKKTLQKFGAFTTNEIDDLKDRICFPLYDNRGNIKAILGRELFTNTKSKYMNYPRHVALPLVPANPRPYKNTLIIVEGIFDMLNLYDKGVTNVLSCLGTSSLINAAEEKLSHFKILDVYKFYIMFDGDKAGNTAAKKLVAKLESIGINAEQIEMPENRDPGDLTKLEVSNFINGLYGNESSSS